jgi:hypothetical protein
MPLFQVEELNITFLDLAKKVFPDFDCSELEAVLNLSQPFPTQDEAMESVIAEISRLKIIYGAGKDINEFMEVSSSENDFYQTGISESGAPCLWVAGFVFPIGTGALRVYSGFSYFAAAYAISG